MQPPKSEICVICGVEPATTRDHVPPKCFFFGLTDAQRSEFSTVPACKACNNGASADDEAMRFYLSLQIGKQKPASKFLWEEKAHKSIKRNTALRNEFLKSVREIPVTLADGKIITRIQYSIPCRLYSAVFERTIRGLYFVHAARILPATVPVFVTMLDSIPNMQLDELQLFQEKNIGGGAFMYRYEIAHESVNDSIWIFEFHGAHRGMAITGAEALAPNTSLLQPSQMPIVSRSTYRHIYF